MSLVRKKCKGSAYVDAVAKDAKAKKKQREEQLKTEDSIAQAAEIWKREIINNWDCLLVFGPYFLFSFVSFLFSYTSLCLMLEILATYA